MTIMIIITVLLAMLVLGNMITQIQFRKIRKNLEETNNNNIYSPGLMAVRLEISDCISIIDDIVNEVFDNYVLLNFTNDLEHLYINEDMELTAVKNIFTTVYTSVSDVVISKLEMVYSTKYIEDLIVHKVQKRVMDIKIEINGNYRE